MNGREHMYLTMLTVFSMYLVLFSLMERIGVNVILRMFSISMVGLYLLISASFFLFCMGGLLPDSDIRDGHAAVYFSIFAPFAYSYRLIELILSWLLNKPVGHRQVMHQFLGILIGSLFIMSIFSIVLLRITSIYAVLFLLLHLLGGQLCHLFQDHLADATHQFAVPIYLALLAGVMAIVVIVLKLW